MGNKQDVAESWLKCNFISENEYNRNVILKILKGVVKVGTKLDSWQPCKWKVELKINLITFDNNITSSAEGRGFKTIPNR